MYSDETQEYREEISDNSVELIELANDVAVLRTEPIVASNVSVVLTTP